MGDVSQPLYPTSFGYDWPDEGESKKQVEILDGSINENWTRDTP